MDLAPVNSATVNAASVNTPSVTLQRDATTDASFREQLAQATTGQNYPTNNHAAKHSGDVSVNNTSLWQRLYGAPTSTPPVATAAPPVDATLTEHANPAVSRRVQQFADAIRTPASIAALELGTSTNTVIAFAGLETGWGRHTPGADGVQSNNLFGIKAHGSHPSVASATTEYVDGEAQTQTEQFRRYQSIGESIADFSRFLRGNPRYNEALLHANNPERFIQLVHEAGYATDPDYADKVIGALQHLNNITTKAGAIGIGWK
jgi:flagellar rod assembly protein/muramidase FlgJ